MCVLRKLTCPRKYHPRYMSGDGDAKAAEQYASAYNKDPEFYEFYRSINAYSEVFANKSDLLVLDPNSEFFKYLQDGNVKK